MTALCSTASVAACSTAPVAWTAAVKSSPAFGAGSEKLAVVASGEGVAADQSAAITLNR